MFAAGALIQALQVAGAGGIAAPGSLSISGTPVVIGTQNVAYAGFSVSGSGGNLPYIYSVHSGTLPLGITLNPSTGAVAGTPTTVVTQTGIVIRVTDQGGRTADLPSFQIAVAAPLTISGTPITVGTQNVAYVGFSATGAGGVTPYAYDLEAGTLPAGITLDPSSGAVAGTPTAVETQTGIIIRVTDADGRTALLPAFQIAVSA